MQFPTDSLPALSLAAALLLIFLGCIGFVLVRGVLRMIVGMLVLGLSAYVAFWLWQVAPALSVEWTGKSVVWLIQVLPVLGFLVTWWVLRRVLRLFTRGAGSSSPLRWPASAFGLFARLFLALIPTAGIGLIAIVMLHHSSSVAEIRASAHRQASDNASLFQQIQSSVGGLIPDAWLEILDPVTDPARVSLAKLISTQVLAPPSPVMDPQTGKPIPRAILVDDPDLQTLAREGNFGTLLRHPLLTKALADPNIQFMLRNLQR
jgi:hypothetical protein